ncbi:AMP-binding protein [Paraglaciecola marina]|uniref:AMP-binding protein n=1 Tax=Paraglaciecola marina TaxID=2500157 RepID=UPI00105C6390|nr:AMP-binding protein [Paraglaciecola marina]
MTNLIAQLRKRETSGVLKTSVQQSAIADLITKAYKIRSQAPQLAAKKVAILPSPIEDLIVGLLAFDGFCEAIYLCPANTALPPVEDLHLWSFTSELSVEVKSTTTSKQTTWYMATSGTTGKPKWFGHSFEALTASIKYSDNLQKQSWGLLYQAYRFAGLQVVLQALLSSADLVDVTGHEPINQVELMALHQVTAVSATPSLWRQLLMTQQLDTLPLRHITLGGEIAEQALLTQLSRLFPKAKLRHIYASTEAGVGFVVADGQAGFPTKWLDNPSLPIELDISEQHHLLVKPQCSVESDAPLLLNSKGFMDTQDRIEIIGDRVFFLGRATGAINVGGNKAYPEKVEQVLLSCDAISQARVYAKKSAMMGELVAADVVLRSDPLITQSDVSMIKLQILKECKKQLQRFEIPTKISFVDNVAYNPSGKLNRQSIGKQHD